MRITSLTNGKVKFLRRLQNERRFRQREGLFVAEGVRWLRDVVQAEFTPREIYISDSAEIISLSPLLDQLACPQISVSAEVMAEISDLETPPGILLVIEQPKHPLPDSPSLLLILDRIQTPGNLGSMLRTAAAAGVDGIVLMPGCVDLYNPKVVRGAMGAHLRIAVATLEWDELRRYVGGMRCWVASAEAEMVYSAVDWKKPAALIIGNEANGPGDEARAMGQGLSIAMAAETESLNAATAAAVMLFEAARQRG